MRRRSCATTLSSSQVRFKLPPKAARTQVPQERGRADGSIARSAPPGAAAPLPRGALSWTDTLGRRSQGYAPPRVGNDVGSRPWSWAGCAGSPGGWQGCGACQRSSTRRRRVPPPTTASGQPAWYQAGRQARMAWPLRLRRSGHRTFALDRRASCPTCSTSARAIRPASTPRGGRVLPPAPPSSLRAGVPSGRWQRTQRKAPRVEGPWRSGRSGPSGRRTALRPPEEPAIHRFGR